MFEWKEEYATGIDTIDKQHKQLLKLAESTLNLMGNVKESDVYDEIVEQIEALINYTRTHFSDEEDIMEKYNYPDIVEHRKGHAEIMEKLESIDFADIDDNQEDFLKDLVRFIGKWILSHVLSVDMKYKLYFKDNNINVTE